jgi:ubiquinone/menaquinone biosynthesis C-methylase UbiE
MRNHHSAVEGVGGTARPGTKVKIIRALLAADKGEGGNLLDVGCGFGHMMLAAVTTGFDGACGCDLPDNEVQRIVIDAAKANLKINPETLCEWIGNDVRNLILPERLRRIITAVYSFWNGLGPEPQLSTLMLCRDKLVNVRSLAVYKDKNWRTPT